MNDTAFFNAVRGAPFPGRLTGQQVDGMTTILASAQAMTPAVTDAHHLAYVLATAYWETAHTMQPVIETFNLAYDTTNPSVETAISRLENSWKAGHMPWVKSAYWRKDMDGLSWLGRGYPQVTHKENYVRAEKETGVPFSTKPELMLVAANAAPVMLRGMLEGWFTGKKLSDYFNATVSDPIGARRIINGQDHAAEIAVVYTQFMRALTAV